MTDHRNDDYRGKNRDKHHDKRRDERAEGLDALYREIGDVEPDGGLDRIIRARAEEAAGSQRSSHRLPWLGGLVTASVAIVAIAVVLQQSPPSQPSPETGAPLERSAPEAYMAPSMGAQSQREVPVDVRRARSDTRGEADSSLQTHRAEAREALSEAATEPRPRPTEQSEAEPAAPSSDADDSAPDRLAGSRLEAEDSATLKSGDALIEKLRELIEAGRIDEARRMFNEAYEREPELDLPEDIERALRQPDPNHPGTGPDSEPR